MGTDFDILFVTVPTNSIVHPLCVFPDCGGQENKHFVVLPKRNWSQFFGNLINQSTEIALENKLYNVIINYNVSLKQ